MNRLPPTSAKERADSIARHVERLSPRALDLVTFVIAKVAEWEYVHGPLDALGQMRPTERVARDMDGTLDEIERAMKFHSKRPKLENVPPVLLDYYVLAKSAALTYQHGPLGYALGEVLFRESLVPT